MNDSLASAAARADLTALEAMQLLERLSAAPVIAAPVIAAPSHSAPATPTAAAPAADALPELLRRELCALAADVLKLAIDEVPAARPLIELGLDSIGATDLMGRFNERFALNVPSTVLFEFDNLAELTGHLIANHEAHLRERVPGAGVARMASGVVAAVTPAVAVAAVAAVAPVASVAPVALAPTVQVAPVVPVAPAVAVAAIAPVTVASVAPVAPVSPVVAEHAAPLRRRDVKTLWAEIDAALDAEAAAKAASAQYAAMPASASISAAAATGPRHADANASADTNDAWAECQAQLVRLFGRGRSVAFPTALHAESQLPQLAGFGGRAVTQVMLTAASGAALRIDPHSETALEALLALAGNGTTLFLTLDFAGRGAGTPTHLLRAIERLRQRGNCLLGLHDATLADPAALLGLARAVEPDFCVIGTAPLVALHLGAPLLASADTGAFQRSASRYLNQYAADELRQRLAAAADADALAGQMA